MKAKLSFSRIHFMTTIVSLWAVTQSASAQSGWGNALALNGANQYVTVEGMDLRNTPLTIELWAKRASIGTWDGFVGQGTYTSSNGLFFALRDNNVAVLSFYSGGLYTTESYTDTDWHHWAATYDPVKGRRLYRDGELVAADEITWAFTGTGLLYIAQIPFAFNSYFHGMIDDVRIWNLARSQQEIASLMEHPLTGTESNLMAYWNFDEADGIPVIDGTTNGYDGMLVNEPARAPSTIPPFANFEAGLPGVYNGAGAWGDYDNDGLLDVVLINETGIAEVWRNTGNGFVNSSVGMPWTPFMMSPSVTWGDYDNDGRLDLLVAGTDGLAVVGLQVWRNTGSEFVVAFEVFNFVPLILDPHDVLPASWGDYDNDGRLDILWTGFTDPVNFTPTSTVLRNTGSGFTNINDTLPGVRGGSVVWGDYDNDGLLDVLLSGLSEYPTPGPITQVWRNTGTGFTNINAGLPGVGGPGGEYSSSAAWGDYDNDGRLDIVLSGYSESPIAGPITQVWRNTENGFVDINAGLPGLRRASVAWGDYDNDGRLDILLSGISEYPTTGPITQVWRNTGSGFSLIDTGLPGRYDSTAVWGDYNNDGRLDILQVDEGVTEVWRNKSPMANSPPISPNALKATAVKGSLRLSWNSASDGQTPSDGLTYNLRIGTMPDGQDILSPQADVDTGMRRLPAMGNVQQGLTALMDLPWGIYYWSVQAVDTAFAGSPFADEELLVIAVETFPATDVTLKTATLHGQANPNGLTTTAWFEWGDTDNYGQVTTVANLAAGSEPLSLNRVVTGWKPGTYHYRMVATNDLGFHVGADEVFEIESKSPIAVTLSATDVAATTATLRGEINPRWAETRAWFEYGLTTKYGTSTPPVDLGQGADIVPFGIPASGLLPWMTYHYRVVSSNSVGVTVGEDITVTLTGPSSTAPSLSALPDLILPQGGSTSVVFTASPADVDLRIQCNNPVLVPPDGLILGGFNGTRILTLTPDPGQSGSAQITVTASDGSIVVSDAINLTVSPLDTDATRLLFLADAQAVSGEAWRFRLLDYGTGSTNYTVECRPDLSLTNQWVPATNVTDLGGGWYEVDTGPIQGVSGFYRVKGIRWLSAGLTPSKFVTEEGDAGGVVIQFNGVYSGTVNYTWTDLAGLSHAGSIQVTGTTAAIPLPVDDNAEVDQLRSFTLQLESGMAFALRSTSTSSVTVEENDADWRGVLQTGEASVGFVLSIQQTATSLQGLIRSEGFGFFPTNALAQLTITTNNFTAVATNVSPSLMAGSPLLGATHHLDLRLEAINGEVNQSVSPAAVQGTATIVMVVPGRPYLDSVIRGIFVLQKPPVAPATDQLPLDPVP